MKRRTIIAALGGTAAAWPLAAQAQQAPMPVAGFLFSEARDASTFRVDSFRQGLKEAGYIEGQNVVIEYRWGDGHRDRLPALAADLIDRKVAVICAGNINSAMAAKAVAGTTPIVFLTAGDPIEDGLVASFNHPGGNATGVRIFSAGLVAKRLQLLHDLVPTTAVVGFLMNPTNPTAETQVENTQAAARAIGLRIVVVAASDERGLDTVFETLAQQKADALAVGADPFFSSRSEQLIRLAARYRLPAVYEWRESAAAGGLMSYGTSLADAFRNLGVYTGRILKGVKPSDLPVMQQTRFELVINLKTANALGLKVPALLLAQADEVVE
jgi:putative ABC transport system substrate-binding protein